MKRLFAGTLALVMTCGLLFSGCGKRMTPEEEAASQEAAISQQLQDEENKTGLKRLIRIGSLSMTSRRSRKRI